MKKFIYIFFYVLLCCVLFRFFISTRDSFSSSSAGAVVETSHTVNFYDIDNETVIYSVNVPNGLSLQELQDNNLVQDSTFSETVDFSSTVYHKWYSNRVTSANCYWSNSDNGFIYTTAYAWSGINYAFEFSEDLSDVYYLTLNARLVSGLPRLGIYTRYYTDTGSIVNKDVQYILNNSLSSEFKTFTLVIPRYEDFSFCSVNLWHNSSDTTNISTYEFNYINLTIQNTNYFNLNYVERLILNSPNLTNNFTLGNWSLSKDIDTNFNFSQPITTDINIYCNPYNLYESNTDNLLISNELSFISNLNISNIDYFLLNGAFHTDINLSTKDYAVTLLNFNKSNLSISFSSINDIAFVIAPNFNTRPFTIRITSDTAFNLTYVNNNFSLVIPANTSFKLSFIDATFSSSSPDSFSTHSYNYFGSFDNFLSLLSSNSSFFDFTSFDIPFSDFLTSLYSTNNLIDFSSSSDLYLYIYINNNNTWSDIRTDSVNLFFNLDSFVLSSYSSYFDNLSLYFSINSYVSSFSPVINTLDNDFILKSDFIEFGFYDLDYKKFYYLSSSDLSSSYGSYPFYVFNSTIVNKVNNGYLSSFSINFDDTYSFYVSNLSEDKLVVNVPFTFNSIFYNPPLDIDNNLSDFGFELPTYLDTTIQFSLSPLKLVIPFDNMIYNFFIYLLFYAPLLSDITFLIYSVIQAFIRIFNLIIGFFVGVSSNFFICLILGFIILSFILKLIFGGKT